MKLVSNLSVATLLLANTLIGDTQAHPKGKSEKKRKPKRKTKDKFCAEVDEEDSEKVYDYIVAGAGAGGGVVASRLAEAGFKTLLLDAGPDFQAPSTEAPLLWPLATDDPNIEWAFKVKTTDDPGRDQVLYPRSSNIGGCTEHNALIAFYPYPGFFDSLKDLTGDI
jgi:hypothetical protein